MLSKFIMAEFIPNAGPITVQVYFIVIKFSLVLFIFLIYRSYETNIPIESKI